MKLERWVWYSVLVGIRLAARKSRAFPYRLYKIESQAALGVAGLVLLTAYEFARDALFTPPARFRRSRGCLCC